MSFSPKPAVRMRTSSGTRPPRKGVSIVSKPSPGQHLASLLDGEDELGSVGALERPDEPAVNGCHRRHVARAEALEPADLDAFWADHVGGFLDRLVDLVRLPQVAGDRRADVYVARADGIGSQHVVEGGDRGQ